MKESPTGMETTTGSNPAGVAAQTTPEETGNADRTELRSVATPEDPRRGHAELAPNCPRCHTAAKVVPCERIPGWRCLECDSIFRPSVPEKFTDFETADGEDAGVGLAQELVDKDGRPVSARRPAPGDVVQFKGRDDNWFRVVVRAIDAEGLEAMTLGQPPRQVYRIDGDWRWPEPSWPSDWPESEEVRRCTAIVVVADEDHIEDECGAVIGKDVHCGICEGRRCYQHCASLDHFKGNVVDSGTAANGSLEWQVVEFAAGRFAGQIQRGTELLAVVGLDSPLERDQVVLQLEHRVKLLELGAPPTAKERRRRDSGRELHAGLFDALAATQGRIAPATRVELVREVIAWLRSCEDEWGALVPDVPAASAFEAIIKAKRLHDEQVLGLFARLAGAL